MIAAKSYPPNVPHGPILARTLREAFKDMANAVANDVQWALWVMAVARQRRELGRLDNRMLKDIGLTREQAQAEAARPFWDLP